MHPNRIDTYWPRIRRSIVYNLSCFKENLMFSFATVKKLGKTEHVDRPYIMVCYKINFLSETLFRYIDLHTTYIVTPTDRPKSVRNRCVIEVFGGVLCCHFVFRVFLWVKGFFVKGLSQISSFVSIYAKYATGVRVHKFTLRADPSNIYYA